MTEEWMLDEKNKVRVATDVVCVYCQNFDAEEKDLHVLLIERLHPPFQGCWALPGGLLEEHELIILCASRELEEETYLAISPDKLKFVGVFDKPERDPRGRTIDFAYVTGFCGAEPPEAEGGDDAKQAKWFSLSNLPELAFDHKEVIAKALETIGM